MGRKSEVGQLYNFVIKCCVKEDVSCLVSQRDTMHMERGDIDWEIQKKTLQDTHVQYVRQQKKKKRYDQ